MTVYHQLFWAALAACTLTLVSTYAVADTGFVLKRELDTRGDVTCTSETAFGNLIGDALKKRHGVDIGLVNCAVVSGNKVFAAGSAFTPAHAAAEIAADQTLVIIEVNGGQLLDTLEQAVAALPAASMGFPQVAGLRMDVDLKKPAGTRVTKLTVNGEALDLARSYTIATASALADGAAGYAQFKSARRIETSPVSIAADVSAYVQDNGVDGIKVLGRIEVLK